MKSQMQSQPEVQCGMASFPFWSTSPRRIAHWQLKTDAIFITEAGEIRAALSTVGSLRGSSRTCLLQA